MYRATIENRGDSKSYVTTRHATFVLDTQGDGANPVDTLLASLSGCLGHYVRDFLTERQLDNSFIINAEAGTTLDKTGLGVINVCVELNDVQLDSEESAALLQFMKNCKVYKVLHPGCEVSISLISDRPA